MPYFSHLRIWTFLISVICACMLPGRVTALEAMSQEAQAAVQSQSQSQLQASRTREARQELGGWAATLMDEGSTNGSGGPAPGPRSSLSPGTSASEALVGPSPSRRRVLQPVSFSFPEPTGRNPGMITI